MTQEQIQTYEYCKAYKNYLTRFWEDFPMQMQKFGCGSQAPPIENTLQKMHEELHSMMNTAVDDKIEEVEQIIKEL